MQRINKECQQEDKLMGRLNLLIKMIALFNKTQVNKYFQDFQMYNFKIKFKKIQN